MKISHLASILLAICCLPGTSFGWSADGHQTVGAIADKLISGSPAEIKVKQLLGSQTLENVSIWADCVKGINPEKNFAYTSAGKYPECAPFETPAAIAAMSDYVRRNFDQCKPQFDEETCHKQYHYADVAIEHDHYKTGFVGTSDHDIVQAIAASIRYLKTQTAPAPFQFKDQSEALMLLTHLVGDIHQPLHVGSVFLDKNGKLINPDEAAKQGNYDRGSNTVGGNALQCPCGNLHALWDDLPPSHKRGRMNDSLTKSARALKLPTQGKDTQKSIEQWPELWANDAIADAKILFTGTQFSQSNSNGRNNNWSVALPLEYEKTMLKLKEQALIKAGARLAQVLQTIWPE